MLSKWIKREICFVRSLKWGTDSSEWFHRFVHVEAANISRAIHHINSYAARGQMGFLLNFLEFSFLTFFLTWVRFGEFIKARPLSSSFTLSIQNTIYLNISISDQPGTSYYILCGLNVCLYGIVYKNYIWMTAGEEGVMELTSFWFELGKIKVSVLDGSGRDLGLI